ncbi:PAS domain-containing protein [Halorubrum sp. CBA1125]|uniref:hybrid sensor histidine kinase/response regulator n=1 Tax=Halorubrum sp. CBA1125 TaxID=2668072 RepID=UPI0012E979D0|nr:PAS domain-containing protein [Halorubrum sp. CBA1125]MUW14409.1 PAS domain-containing protein [Halorubrum sp. CBA1125]
MSALSPPVDITTEALRVLHVEDDPDLAALTATYLEREDDRFEVATATRATEGLDRLAEANFDCIVSDYDMPGATGVEFLEAVREEYPDLPFILYTGKGSEEVASEAISAGVTDYLQKEAGTSQYTVLAHRISNVVAQYRSRRAVEETEQKLSQLAEKTDDILFMFTGDWSELLFLNSTFEDIWGIPVERVEENPEAFLEHIHPEDRDHARRSMKRLSAGHPDEIEYRVVPPDDDQRWVRGQSKPIFDDDGTVTRIVGFVRDISEQKERNRRFEAIFNNTYTFVGLLEPDGTLIEANDTALSFGGLDREDVVGKPLWETYWVQSNEETQRIVREGVEHARNGELFRDEIRVRGSDREAVIDFSIRPVTDEHGEVTLLIPEGRDITERKREENKRQQIIDRVTDAIVEVDADWTFTLVNEQAEELYDMDEEDLLGRDFWEVFHEARDTRFEEEYRRVMETREPTSFVEHFSQLDGWFDISAYPKENGGIEFYFVEVTEQRERQHELEQTNTVLSTLFETLPVGVLAEDPGRNVLAANERMFDLFDLPGSPEAVVGADCERLADQVSDTFVDSERFVRRIAELIANREPKSNEELALRDGRTFERDYRPIELPGGEGHLWVYKDITELKEREQALQRERDRLDEFAGVVSHDLRNPLSVAQGRLELAREACDSGHLDAIETALQRIDRITEDVLWLAREGRDIGSLDAVAVRDVIDGAWNIVADRTEHAELRYAGDEFSLVTIEADDDRLRQLFENLFSNAIEHGGGDVTVTVGAVDDGFYVEDDGPGIPEDRRHDVFAAGYSTGEAGTGFGLSIVKRVVEAHGWEIRVTDGTDGGARFEITGVEFTSE